MTAVPERAALPSLATVFRSRAGVELKEFFRQREAVVFTVALPVLLLVVFGAVLNYKIGFGVTFTQYFMAGIIAAGILGAGLQNTILALTISFIPPVIRISESVTTQVRHLDFVEAARASGARPLTIMRYHILNNVLGPILVYATSLISICIILAAGLSFLGLGVTPPSAEWGLMLNNLRQALWVSPFVAALPGVMIFITSMCFNLMSDGLRQAMDVRL